MAETLDPKLIGELLALVTHDLRNPLAALQSNLGFLEAVIPEGDEDAKDALEDGLASCDNLAHMIDNVDLFGRELRGSASAAPASVDLGNLTERVVADAQPVAKSYGLQVHYDPESQTGVRVSAGQDIAVRAVANLVRNSIQHGGSGSVVTVTVGGQKGEAIVRIEDAGSPLSPSLGAAAFTAEGLSQSKSVAQGRYSRGLGMYIAGLAARVCGGSVSTVPPSSGKTNAFELRLPRGS